MEGKIITNNMDNLKNALKQSSHCIDQNVKTDNFQSSVIKYVDLINNYDEKGRSDALLSKLERDRVIVDSAPAENTSDIQKFYVEKNVFITGATGFLGKVLIEKLLRSCTGVENLYLLVRQKKGKDIYTRVEEIFDDPLYDLLKEEVPKFRHKIVVMQGDCESTDLGLSLNDRQTLTEKVNIIFHAAATVKFDEHLRAAFATNVMAPLHLLRLAKDMKQLNVLMHVSTAYSNCHLTRIEEKFYPTTVKCHNVAAILDDLTDKQIDDQLHFIIGPWPNTYTFTKALAENELLEKASGLPLGIFRPAIVTSTAKEPLSCWIDNMYGPTGVVVGAVTGVLRTLQCDASVTAEIVPVDLVVNCLLVAARDVCLDFRKAQPPPEPPIFNFVCAAENRITWRDFMHHNFAFIDSYPLASAVWYASLTLNKRATLNRLYMLFLHLLPALLVDTLAVCVGQKPKLMKVYKKIHKFSSVLSYFCTHRIDFRNERTARLWVNTTPTDRLIFPFNMSDMNWEDYFSQYIRGIRLYLFHETDETLPRARRHWTRLYYLHQTVRLLFYGLLIYAICSILISIF